MHKGLIYVIRLEGQLDPMWSDWLGGMQMRYEPNGETLLEGAVVDQAALYGLLAALRDLGLPLISVTRGEPSTADKQETQ